MSPLPDFSALFAALDGTWPAAASQKVGAWTVRDGRGGGKRVSCATTDDEAADLAPMEAAQGGLGQPPLVMARSDQPALKQRLQAAGYTLVDPTCLYAAPAADLVAEPPRVTVFTTDWPALEIVREIWAEGGIGPARLAIMDRAQGPKTVLMGRVQDRPGAAAFLAIHDNIAMIHALEVLSARRRSGLARHMMGVAAKWAQDHGATTLALAVTEANAPANALYSSLNMTVMGNYTYWLKH